MVSIEIFFSYNYPRAEVFNSIHIFTAQICCVFFVKFFTFYLIIYFDIHLNRSLMYMEEGR